MVNTDIESLIPHRGRMKFIDEIIEVDENSAITESIVTDQWPLIQNNDVNPLVLIELVAQTSAVSIGWKESKDGRNSIGGRGWLVGIKTANLFIDRIPLNTRIRTRAEINFDLDGYTQIHGTSKIGPNLIGDIVLQVLTDITRLEQT